MKLSDFLYEIQYAIENHEDIDIDGVRTFDEAGLLTYNSGLIVRLNDGSEFQVTVVQSQDSTEDDDEDEDDEALD